MAQTVIKQAQSLCRSVSARLIPFLALLTFNVNSADLQAQSIVSPIGLEDEIGISGVSLGFSFQQIHVNTEFVSASSDIISITGVSFRWDEATASGQVVLPYIGIGMGTFTKPYSQMSIRASENRGSDYRQVYSEENVRLNAGSPTSASDFSLNFALNEPFYYDRRGGHLLLDIAAARPPNYLPVIGWDGDFTRAARDHLQHLSLSVPGSVSAGGLVVQFTYVAIPEPSPLAILCGSFIVFAVLQCIRK